MDCKKSFGNTGKINRGHRMRETVRTIILIILLLLAIGLIYWTNYQSINNLQHSFAPIVNQKYFV